ncbi:MAG: hypothetical protein CMJ74_01170 [Planctomycetaceae bacterium]|nr:hypothetical protein [Planctomycetaceae bacterium]
MPYYGAVAGKNAYPNNLPNNPYLIWSTKWIWAMAEIFFCRGNPKIVAPKGVAPIVASSRFYRPVPSLS